jgi:hypothetical protein
MADVGSSLLVEGYDPEDHVEKWPAVGRGFLTVWNDTHKVERSGRYWTFACYSRHVRRGARVFQTDTLGDSRCAACILQLFRIKVTLTQIASANSVASSSKWLDSG